MKKSVILIGNGPSMINCGLGNKIDEFDEIVRINDWKTLKFERDTGTKTTIWAMYNPEKAGYKFTEGYKSMGITLDLMKDSVKDIKEIWYTCWNKENLMRNYKKNIYIKELGIYNKIKRHESIGMSRVVKRDTNPPSTGYTLIKILTTMYDKVYITGFNFGVIINSNSELHHYYGTKLSKDVIDHDIHKMDTEYKLVKDLEKQGKIVFLKEDSEIIPAEYIYTEKDIILCKKCKRINYLYRWEQRICNYCESKLI